MIEAKIIAGLPDDQLPSKKITGDAIFYVRLDGVMMLRWMGNWIELTNPVLGSISIRGNLLGKTWTKINFPKKYLVRPNYSMTLRNKSDINKTSYATVRNLGRSSLEVYAQEACNMELNIFPINGETTL